MLVRILFATILVGTGFGIAFFPGVTFRSNDLVAGVLRALCCCYCGFRFGLALAAIAA
jgi:uncharacterized membrane protein